jgi:hypothetical protein
MTVAVVVVVVAALMLLMLMPMVLSPPIPQSINNKDTAMLRLPHLGTSSAHRHPRPLFLWRLTRARARARPSPSPRPRPRPPQRCTAVSPRVPVVSCRPISEGQPSAWVQTSPQPH